MRSEFDEKQFGEAYPEGIEKHFWNRARNGFVENALNDAVRSRLFDRDERILEVGCGTGVVVRHLKAKGWCVVGVDLGRPKLPKGEGDALFLGVAAEDLPEPLRSEVRVILLLDVIEHIDEPVAFLASLRKAFPNCSVFVINVPARMEVWSNYDEHFGHHRRYDKGSLQETLSRASLECVRMDYLFHSLYWVARLMSFLKVQRSVKQSTPRLRMLHGVLGYLMQIEHMALKIFGRIPGLSLMSIAVAERNEPQPGTLPDPSTL